MFKRKKNGDSPSRASRAAVEEAYNSASAKISMLLGDKEDCKTILVTNVGSKSNITVAEGLAEAFSRYDNNRVLLMDCNLRTFSPEIVPIIADDIGIADYVRGRAELKNVIRQIKPSYHMISSGKDSHNSFKLLASEAFRHMKEELEIQYSFIIADAPPFDTVSDTLAIAKYFDGVVLTITPGESGYKEIKKTIDLMDKLNIRLLGVIFT